MLSELELVFAGSSGLICSICCSPSAIAIAVGCVPQDNFAGDIGLDLGTHHPTPTIHYFTSMSGSLRLPLAAGFSVVGCDLEIRQSLTYFLTIASLNFVTM